MVVVHAELVHAAPAHASGCSFGQPSSVPGGAAAGAATTRKLVLQCLCGPACNSLRQAGNSSLLLLFRKAGAHERQWQRNQQSERHAAKRETLHNAVL